MTQGTFTNIIAWQKAHQFVLTVYRIAQSFPLEEKRGLWSQFTRAAVSIAANIAEGSRKMGKAEKLRFLNISQGSLEECRYYIILSKDLGYINEVEREELDYAINGASWYLNAYASGIKDNAGIKDI